MYTKLTSRDTDHRVKYFHWSILSLVAMVIAHLIVVESQEKPILTPINQHNYQLAMGFSWPFTFLLMLWIHYATIKMDVIIPWASLWPERILMQILFGVVFVLLANIAIVRAYFSVLGGNFEKSGYMEIEFPIIRWMVLFMNASYIAFFFAQNYFKSKKMYEGLKDQISQHYDNSTNGERHTPKIEAKLGSKIVQLAFDDVACFVRSENIGYVYLLDGRKFNINLKLGELTELLDSTMFYQINRSVIISFAAVRGYEKVKNLQAIIIIRDDLELDVSLLVSRERFDGFRKKFDTFKLQ